ncbi:hypothetical protein MRX96_027915 [Rhipicephalus microplus]
MNLRTVLSYLQSALNAVVGHVTFVGLAVSSAQIEGTSCAPHSKNSQQSGPSNHQGHHSTVGSAVTCLRLRIDHRLSWAPAVKEATCMLKKS